MAVFEDVDASPRIEVQLRSKWHLVILRPETLGGAAAVFRLVWNPTGNTALYLTPLAERASTEPAGPAPALLAARVAGTTGLRPTALGSEPPLLPWAQDVRS